MVCVVHGLPRFEPHSRYYCGEGIGKFDGNILKQRGFFFLFNLRERGGIVVIAGFSKKM